MKKLMVILLLVIAFSGCNVLTRYAGGTTTLKLPAGKKLINITWKDANIWYLTRDMKVSDVPETYEFKESSMNGIAEGTVVVVESR